MRRIFSTVLACGFISAVAAGPTLNHHPVRLDLSGKLVSWIQPQSQAYGRALQLAWDFLEHKVPTANNGLKLYYTYSTIDSHTLQAIDWPHNPAGLYAMFADAAREWFPYSGDQQAITLVRGLMDYQLAHGTTPSDWPWANVPFSSADAGATEYRGGNDSKYGRGKTAGPGDGYEFLEPDKVGELGYGYAEIYEITGESRYQTAAINCADTLARNIRNGDELHSPWPFRVNARTRAVKEEYSANVIGPIRLFDELIRQGWGKMDDYKRARQIAWDWMMRYPMANGKWDGYFEDISVHPRADNFNNYSPLETARYMMLHPDMDSSWREHVPALIHLVEEKLIVDAPREPALQWGARAVSEQLDDMNKMVSHTSRYASVEALWYEKTGDGAAKEIAYRAYNWSTYMVDADGRVVVGPVDQSIWFTDGYGDFLRNLMAGLGSVPEWAPPRKNHLLRSSSAIRQVNYSSGSMEYSAFEPAGEEVLRLQFRPKTITLDGKPLPSGAHSTEGYKVRDLEGGDVSVRIVRRNGRAVKISG